MRLVSPLLLVALALSDAACAGGSAAAPPPATPTPTPAPGPTPASDDAVPGGYTRQDVSDDEVRAEADQAITLLRQRQNDPGLSLTTIRSAATQVVAGLNYRFVLDVSTASGPRQVQVVMYRDLQQQRSLTEVSGL